MTGLSAYIISQLEKELETLPAPNNEITQHLIELGYISMQKTNALTVADLAAARKHFLEDVYNSEFFTNKFLDAISLQGKSYMLTFLLRKLTDIDEGITISALPERGDLNLLTRLIHYRLDLFGMWPMEVASPFSNLSFEKLGEIADFAKSTKLEVVNHLADIEQFTSHLLSIHPQEKFILVFRSPKVKEKTRKKLDRRQAFKRQMIEDFGDRTDFVKYMAGNILKNREQKVDFSFLQREANDPFKRFIMRLLQIHQWQDGFYSGLLDSDMGEVTLESFLQTISFYNSTDGKQIKTHRTITYVHRGFFVFNSLFFLQEYMIEEETPKQDNAELNLLDSISSQLQKSDESDQEAFNTNLNKLKADIYKDARVEPKERKGFLQRIYFGIKRLVKKAIRFVRKIYSWIKEKVEKFWGFLKNLFRNFFENLQLGIRAFIDGINFIFGNKGIKSAAGAEMIVSKFSIDGDSVSFSTQQISNVLEEHLQTIGYNISAMKFTLSVVAGILKVIIKMVSIITWPLLLLNIIKIYKNIATAFQDVAKAA